MYDINKKKPDGTFDFQIVGGKTKDQISADKKPIAWGFISDHLTKFEGMPTQIHEVRREISAGELDEKIKKIKMELAEKKVDAIEVEQGDDKSD